MSPAPPKVFAGVFPIAPTPFAESGEIDLEGQRRVLDCMVDQGVDGICILANYSEQFLLTERSAPRWSNCVCRTSTAACR
jgi:2-keto-3-deoxy-L-arabinonate dehydratase